MVFKIHIQNVRATTHLRHFQSMSYSLLNAICNTFCASIFKSDHTMVMEEQKICIDTWPKLSGENTEKC